MYIKLVAEALAVVFGSRSRDGFIHIKLESPQLMPNFNTKAEYHIACYGFYIFVKNKTICILTSKSI